MSAIIYSSRSVFAPQSSKSSLDIVPEGKEIKKIKKDKYHTYYHIVKHSKKDPDVIRSDGTCIWIDKNKMHREDGPAIEYPDGDKAWYKEGKLHRLDGPAVDKKLWKEWRIDGKLHREDGPAIISNLHPNVDHRWFLDDEPFTFEAWLDKISTDDQTKIMMILKWL